MKCIRLIAFLCLLSACRNGSSSYYLEQKVNDLEYRINLLERNLAEKEAAPQTSNNYKAPTPTTRSTKTKRVTARKAPAPKTYESQDSYNSSTKNVYSYRCQATTKKGSQCKRTARSAGYCWQHGG